MGFEFYNAVAFQNAMIENQVCFVITVINQ